MTRERFTLPLLLAATFAIRALYPDQPIVENYVGRQIPTAMVARNLERGSGFLHPQLDTGPFPNLFLVEPPIYAQLVAWARPAVGFDLEAIGRLVSAAATTLAAWGLFGLARRREGPLVALLALASFGMFPVMIRYGRAFQPDALMLGCVLAGLRGWDEYQDRGDWRWAAFGGFVLSIGFALKITTAWALIGFVLIVRRWSIGWRLAGSVAMLAPVFAWYMLAWDQVTQSGSSASADNARLWARSLSPEAWLRFSTYENLGRALFVRSFTPIGFVLAAWGLTVGGFRRTRRVGLAPPLVHDSAGQALPNGDGLIAKRPLLAPATIDRLWLGWGIGCALSILGLASKWHHAYYWMVVAPLAAVGVARGLVSLAGMGKCGGVCAASLGSSLLVLCLFQSASTWRTPVEWARLIEAAEAVEALTSEDELVIAPEAVLYYANRRGYRLEFDPVAARRAAGEWGGSTIPNPHRPLALTELYRMVYFSIMIDNNAFFPLLVKTSSPSIPTAKLRILSQRLLVADVGPEGMDPGRRAWRSAIRHRLNRKLIVDRPDLMIAEIR